MYGAFEILVIFGIAAFLIGAKLRANRRRLAVVEDTLRAMGAQPKRFGNNVQGTVRGVAVSYQLDDSDENSPPRTVCRASLAGPAPAFEMDLRPQTASEERHVLRGRAIDLAMGDPAFDDAYIVEAAPSDIARAILDGRARADLLAAHPCRLKVSSKGFCWEKQARVDNASDVRRIVELCVFAAERLGALQVEFHDREMSRAFASAGYRGPSPEALRTAWASAPEAGRAEIDALKAVRARRRAWQVRWVGLVVVSLILFFSVWGIVNRR